MRDVACGIGNLGELVQIAADLPELQKHVGEFFMIDAPTVSPLGDWGVQ